MVATRSGLSDSDTDPMEAGGDTVRPEPGQQVMWDRLTEVLKRLAMPQRPATPCFKPPHYDGTGDVVGANQWSDGAALLHLRQALEGDAKDCGRPTELEEVFDNLRARFWANALGSPAPSQ